MERTFLDYNKIETWLVAQAEAIKSWQPNLIVGILRGGAFPAVLLSQITDIPVAFMWFDRARGVAQWDSLSQAPSANQRVLLCEDFAGSGVTLMKCLEWLRAQGCTVRVLTLAHDRLSRHVPNYAIDLKGHKIIFPWERFALSEKNREARNKLDENGLGTMPLNTQLEQWAYDLDGVFLPDLPETIYKENLKEALLQRHASPKHNLIPPIRDGAFIITGRIFEDESMTKEWLQREGIDYLRLILRDSSRYSAAETWLHKAETILAHGVSHFVESCPRQSLLIASHCPHVQVMYWDITSGQGYWCTAFQQAETFSTRNIDC